MGMNIFQGLTFRLKSMDETMLECAGITFNVSESNQPVYGYASNLYDAVLPGRRIIQGSFIVNFSVKDNQLSILNDFLNSTSFINDTPLFNITVNYGIK